MRDSFRCSVRHRASALTVRALSPEIGSARTPAHRWRQGRACRLLKQVPQPHLRPNLASRIRPPPVGCFLAIGNLRQCGPAADGVENTWRSSSIQQPRLSCRFCRQPGTAECAERPHDNDSRTKAPSHDPHGNELIWVPPTCLARWSACASGRSPPVHPPWIRGCARSSQPPSLRAGVCGNIRTDEGRQWRVPSSPPIGGSPGGDQERDDPKSSSG